MTTFENVSLPHPPFYTIPNISNLRDCALYPSGLQTTNPPGEVRSGILFRSADVSKLSSSGWQSLKDLGITHIFDLRSKPEIDKSQSSAPSPMAWVTDMEKEGICRTWTPVFEESDYSPERLAERFLKYMDDTPHGFVEAYTDILRHAGPAFRTILRHLAGLRPPVDRGEQVLFLSNDPLASAPTEDSPFSGNKVAEGVLVHCTGGKDRTGVFYAVLFSFLGVGKDIIAGEYQLTETGLMHIREEQVKRLTGYPGYKRFLLSMVNGKKASSEHFAEVLRSRQEGKEAADAEDEIEVPEEALEKGRQAALRMLGARKESMLGALEVLEREWGGAEGYLKKECGLEDEELKGLKRGLVVRS
ncbi:hypothetical protein CC78DRAFT_537120 [Lojkania enalia]|uniref:Tyrosine specific protein phosphatases domain-containing protein n=1 Tax=Lojkania enalia TaxID=147567 RepID=A0A9P4MYM0_9PLEO|nr:hypothetical protein CC78DRAFT_537120 [Didymosphaeria enalia]